MITDPNAPALPNADSNGITIREHIATMALQGMLADHTRDSTWGEYAEGAVKFADALIAELNKTQPQP